MRCDQTQRNINAAFFIFINNRVMNRYKIEDAEAITRARSCGIYDNSQKEEKKKKTKMICFFFSIHVRNHHGRGK